MSDMTPREIVQELDKHIIGQADAKRAVAIALRNRWRRAQVAEPLRTEITPKNILMIGPTGVGKPEIQGMFANMGGARRKRRTLRIREALRLLTDEEAAKLVNDEEIRFKALRAV